MKRVQLSRPVSSSAAPPTCVSFVDEQFDDRAGRRLDREIGPADDLLREFEGERRAASLSRISPATAPVRSTVAEGWRSTSKACGGRHSKYSSAGRSQRIQSDSASCFTGTIDLAQQRDAARPQFAVGGAGADIAGVVPERGRRAPAGWASLATASPASQSRPAVKSGRRPAVRVKPGVEFLLQRAQEPALVMARCPRAAEERLPRRRPRRSFETPPASSSISSQNRKPGLPIGQVPSPCP